MHDDRAAVRRRLRRTLDDHLRPARVRPAAPLQAEIHNLPGEPIGLAEALAADYRPIRTGQPWGPPWSTSWFRFTGTVPPGWADADQNLTVEADIDLGFDADRPGFQCEGLARTATGAPIKGLHPRNTHLPAPRTGPVHWYVEAAANPILYRPGRFRPTRLGHPPPWLHGEQTTTGELYRLTRAELVLRDETACALVTDIEVLDGLLDQLPAEDPRHGEVLRALERMLDHLDPHDLPGTAAAARTDLAAVLATPARPGAHRISAVAHAHLDTAWLWPLRETHRKIIRTTAGVLHLLDTHPRMRFAMSQAQQLDWLREDEPGLFERVRAHVRRGGYIPVGGMWVEPDTNLPGGEALARQLAYGKRFFRHAFGVETREVWLPDSFGYSAALPQLIALSGSRWFLPQKLSWNRTNRFPHHTFRWEGIDGTRVFTHFPPADTYEAELTPAELAHAAGGFAEHGRATRSLIPFGHGDGGGGPTRDMLARAERTADLDGLPQVRLESPEEFFTAAEAEHPAPPVWSGELYLEAHRGTYTSQLRTKQGNRRGEHLLREAELWAATAAITRGADYPYERLERCWKTLLLHQFHDILPGTSINWVHREAEATYRHLHDELEQIITTAQHTLAGRGELPLLFNAAPHPRDGVPALAAHPARTPAATTATEAPDATLVLDNGLVRATLDARGLLVSVLDLAADREALPPGRAGNLLQLHPDHPAAWDAWDLDESYRHRHRDLDAVEHLALEGTTAVVERRFGDSRVRQRIGLTGRLLHIDTDLDWHESDTLLKAAFPLAVHAERSTAEIQFGHLHRPTHTNTSWDAARYEICAHRWLHLGETGYGHALINDSTYGHDVTRDTDAGTTITTARLSLLRAPRYPDPDADRGTHRLRYGLLVGAGIPEAIREGYRMNLPARVVPGRAPVAPLVQVDSEAVVIESVKLADDRSGDVVVRLYESLGGRARTRLSTSFPLQRVVRTDLLERRLPEPADAADLRLGPFQILTLRLTPRT